MRKNVLCLFLFVLLLTMIVPKCTTKNVLRIETQSRQSDAMQHVVSTVEWQPEQTALIICDMWNQHWCTSATKRVGELAPKINNFAAELRNKGALIVHAPSDVIDYYKDHQARQNALSAPMADNVPENMDDWCHSIESENMDAWPIDQSDGGCDSELEEESYRAWSHQIDAIEIYDDDVISDSGVEIWNVFEQRGIKNVILVGVHTNMCVIGRPFGLRNMTRVGKNVLLCRDLTDTMYNPKMKPFVSHFKGTRLVISYIEQYVCPTMLSTSVTSMPPFQFKNDNSIN